MKIAIMFLLLLAIVLFSISDIDSNSRKRSKRNDWVRHIAELSSALRIFYKMLPVEVRGLLRKRKDARGKCWTFGTGFFSLIPNC